MNLIIEFIHQAENPKGSPLPQSRRGCARKRQFKKKAIKKSERVDLQRAARAKLPRQIPAQIPSHLIVILK